MSEKKPSRNDTGKTLPGLGQWSLIMEVMGDVVNRLRHHLSRQLQAHTCAGAGQQTAATRDAQGSSGADDTPDPPQPPVACRNAGSAAGITGADRTKRMNSWWRSLIVEIRQQTGPEARPCKILH